MTMFQWRHGALYWFGHRWLEKLRFGGITIFLLVLIAYAPGESVETEIHESIHVKQQYKYWFIGFWVLYAFEHFKNLFRYGNWWTAYAMNKFEIEARDLTGDALGRPRAALIVPLEKK